MDFFTTLLNSYEEAERNGLVDNHDHETILLPLYHTNKRAANDRDIINVTLSTTGQLISAEFAPKDQRIIFPVTLDSIARSSDKTPHPLTDQFEYLILNDNPKKLKNRQNLKQWAESTTDTEIRQFLSTIIAFLEQPDFDTQLINQLYPNEYSRDNLKITYTIDNKSKTDNLGKCYLEFGIAEFKDYATVTVSNFINLHNDYITFLNQQFVNEQQEHPENFAYCNISGRFEKKTTKHRGLLGSAKLISASRNGKGENFAGYFAHDADTAINEIITIGYQTSEKMHLMLKYLLENPNSHKLLGNDNHLIMWHDHTASTSLDLQDLHDDLFANLQSNSISYVTPNKESKTIGDSFTSGQNRINNTNYFIAILCKTSNGRLALKDFENLDASSLYQKLKKWETQYQWESTYNGETTTYTPSITNIIYSAYGHEEAGKTYFTMNANLEQFKSNLYQNCIASLLNGRNLPQSIIKQLENHLKFPKSYPKLWSKIIKTNLAVLSHRKDYQPMLDKTETNRSYLFGRLLALYEQVELKKYYHVDNQKEKDAREPNARRLWTNCVNKPSLIVTQLKPKVAPYEQALHRKVPGVWSHLSREEAEIITLLDAHRKDTDFDKSLDSDFIFGYTAERNFLYTAKQTNESEK